MSIANKDLEPDIKTYFLLTKIVFKDLQNLLI